MTPVKPAATSALSGANGAYSNSTIAESPGDERPETRWQRVWRRRVSRGQACVTVALDRRDIDLLCAAGCLDGRQDFHSRAEVAEALTKFLRIAREAT